MSALFFSKTALVTGAGKGIGRAIALKLANLGTKVYAVSRTESDLDSLRMECGNIDVFNVDIADWDKIRSVVHSLGPIDMLVNNAGVADPSPFLDISQEQMNNQFDINFKAAFNISQGVAKGMVERGRGGSIVNISSIAATRASPTSSVYSCTKAALDMLTRNMATELGPHNIRVNSINPGLVLTPMIERVVGDTEALRQTYISLSPIKRLVELDDVVNATIFLLSDQSAMITGVSLPVTGGALL